jgi:mannose-6-phosphate isomerase-like protein (cupin superfamily)
MTPFATLILPEKPSLLAPDGSDVRILLSLGGGSMAHFELAPGTVSRAVVHRTVEEIWYILAGQGEMWRSHEDQTEVVTLLPGTCLSIPVGTHFQFRAAASVPVSAIAVTLPPWPGADEAIMVTGPWVPSNSG